MKPRPITDTDLASFAGMNPTVCVFTGPGEIESGVAPCEAIVTDDTEPATPGLAAKPVVRVPWLPDSDDIEALAAGGTIWLSSWGGLPIHSMIVDPAVAATGPDARNGEPTLTHHTAAWDDDHASWNFDDGTPAEDGLPIDVPAHLWDRLQAATVEYQQAYDALVAAARLDPNEGIKAEVCDRYQGEPTTMPAHSFTAVNGDLVQVAERTWWPACATCGRNGDAHKDGSDG
ncbi:MAG: hypothetical protein Q7V57_11120 [Actinomycetota bacterium]|nr:hypothetical protein [Actinomycetota bacterium]